MCDAVEAADPAERRGYIDTLKDLRRQIGEHADRFDKTTISDQARATFKEAARLAEQAGGLQALMGRFRLAS